MEVLMSGRDGSCSGCVCSHVSSIYQVCRKENVQWIPYFVPMYEYHHGYRSFYDELSMNNAALLSTFQLYLIVNIVPNNFIFCNL